MRRRLLELAALAAYLPASALPELAARTRDWDPGVLVVPFCALFAVSFPFWGRVADRHDRRLVIAGGLALLGLAGVLVALADSVLVAMIGRGLEGFAAAAIPPAAQAELTRDSGDSRAGRAIGGMMIAVALATLGGPALAGALAGAGWAAPILLLAVALPAAASLLVALLWERRPDQPREARGHRASSPRVASWPDGSCRCSCWPATGPCSPGSARRSATRGSTRRPAWPRPPRSSARSAFRWW